MPFRQNMINIYGMTHRSFPTPLIRKTEVLAVKEIFLYNKFIKICHVLGDLFVLFSEGGNQNDENV